jgi:ABC-type multidrug transport system fused ATPase/permease subunit
VFGGTLRENLAYLRPDATDADLDAAVQALGVEALLERIGGYDGELAAGRHSAGECQLIALTRVWLSPAEVVVLDEATCHLDPAAELRAEEAFRARGTTLVVIAHRISSARRADLVLFMGEGQPRVRYPSEPAHRLPVLRRPRRRVYWTSSRPIPWVGPVPTAH